MGRFAIQLHISSKYSVRSFFLLVVLMLSLTHPWAAARGQMAEGGQELKIVNFMPEEASRDFTRILVRFSEPMRPLGSFEEAEDTAPVKLTAIQGEIPDGVFRWLDPSTLTYTLDEPVNAPLVLKACVPAGTRSVSGKTLDKEFCGQVSTPPLAIELSSHGQTTITPLTKFLYLRSNYPVRLDDLRTKVRLAQRGKPLPVSIEEHETTRDDRNRDLDWIYRLVLPEDVPAQSQWDLTLEAGIRPMKGSGGATAKTLSYRLETYRSLKLDQWSVEPEIGNRKSVHKAPESPIRFSFNNEVSRKDLIDHLEISPAADLIRGAVHPVPLGRFYGGPDEEEEQDRTSAFHSLAFELKPNTTYTVTVRAGLRDIFGGQMGKKETFSFTTGNFYPVFHMVNEGVRYMEPSLGGQFPFIARNTSPIDIELGYLPWSSPQAIGHIFDSALDEEELLQWGGFTKKHRIDLSGQPNAQALHMLDIPELLGFQSAEEVKGFVRLTISAPLPPDRVYNNRTHEKHSSLLQITNLGLHFRSGEDSSLAWVTDLETGRPLEGATVEVYCGKGRNAWSGTTDVDGLVRVPGREALSCQEQVIVARHANDMCAVSGERSGSRWLESHENVSGHMLTQMPLYQPGQKVNYSLFMARETDSEAGIRMAAPEWRPLSGKNLNLMITDSRGREIQNVQVRTNDYGTVTGEVLLGAEAPSGSYTATVLYGDNKVYLHAFQVASFRPPDFRVEVSAPADQPLPQSPEDGNILETTVQAQYFSGASLSGAAVQLETVTRQEWFGPGLLRGYTVGANTFSYHHMPYMMVSSYLPVERDRGTSLSTSSGLLDEEGKLTAILPAIRPEPGCPLLVSLEATVTDSTGLTSQGAASFTAHPSAIYVGIKAPYIVRPNEDVKIELRASTFDNQPVRKISVDLEAERLNRNNEKDRVWLNPVTLDRPEGQAFTIRFDRSGSYEVTAWVEDEQGRKNRTTVNVYVSGAEPFWWGTRTATGMELVQDAEEYKAGDTARILVKNPFAEVDGDRTSALVVMERQGIRSARLVELSGPTPVIDVPIETGDQPYVYVSVILIKGRTAQPPTVEDGRAKDQGAPAMAAATARLLVPGPKKEIRVGLEADRQEYRPGETVRLKVAVSDQDGRARKTQVTLLAVDERYIRAAGDRTSYTVGASFQAIYAYRLWSTDVRNFLMDLGIPLEAVEGRARGAVMMALSADRAPSPEQVGQEGDIRADFSPAAYWLGAQETDNQGRLSTSFTLPDTLTSYRIVAVAMDSRWLTATSEISVKANKPLQILSSMPRFLTGGDSLEARILIQNTGQKEGLVTVTAEAEGLRLGETRKTIRLEPGNSGSVGFPITVDLPDPSQSGAIVDASEGGRTQALASITVRAVMQAGGETERDAARFVLPVQTPAPLTTVAAAGLLSAGEEYVLPVSIEAESVSALDPRSRLEVLMAASPAAGLALTADEVLSYPWGCLEQRISKAWVRAIRLKHGTLLGMEADPEDADILRSVMESLPTFQSGGSGGFSFWKGGYEPNPYLTAFVLMANSYISEVDASPPLSMDRQTLDSACRYLVYALENDLRRMGEDQYSYGTQAESRAMMLAALSAYPEYQRQAAALFEPALRNLEKQKSMTPMAWAGMLKALVNLPMLPDREAHKKRILDNLGKMAAITPTELHFAARDASRYWHTMGSNLRDNGLALGVLAESEPEYPRLEALALWVSRGLADRGKYLTTQEGIHGLIGLTGYLDLLARGSQEGVAIKAQWNGGKEMVSTFNRLTEPPVTLTLRAGDLEDALTGPRGAGEVSSEGADLYLMAEKGNPYWTARLRFGIPARPVTAENMGFIVERRMPEGEIRVGDVVDVRLRITVDANRRHALVFEPFPAGFETLYASRVDLGNYDRGYQPPWQWQDIRTDGILLYTEHMAPGTYTYTYKLRAIAPGRFVSRPAHAEEMYAPEVFGRTAGGFVVIKE